MSVWDGPDDRPGRHDSLYVLYYLVAVAEEEDLLDEVRRERARQVWDFDPWAEHVGERDDDLDLDESADDTLGLTFRQVLGMLEHLLGAVVINPDDEDN